MDFPCRPCSPFCFGQSGYDDNDVDWKLVDCHAYKAYDYQDDLIREAFSYQEDVFYTFLK